MTSKLKCPVYKKWIDFCWWVRSGDAHRMVKRAFWRIIPHQCGYRFMQDHCKKCGRIKV